MAKTEAGLTPNALIRELARSAHGKLEEYIPTGAAAVLQDPAFFAHLVAWNEQKGEVRDAKVALPVIALLGHADFHENAHAHLAMLGPRELLRAYRFRQELTKGERPVPMRGLVKRYLQARESYWPWFEKTAVLHHETLKELYSLVHLKPVARAKDLLFEGKREAGSLADLVARLHEMPTEVAVATILNRKLPWLVAEGALGKRIKEPDILLALMEQMTTTEFVNNQKRLEKLGCKSTPALRGAFEAAVLRVAASKKSTLKTTKAVEAVSDEGTKARLAAVQEKQLDKLSVKGDWLVLGDASPSMRLCIETAKDLAAVLARAAEGAVHLVFFSGVPEYYDATGLTLEEVRQRTRHVVARGGTSIGCGLAYAIEMNLPFDGIAVVSDAQENTAPHFAATLKRYVEKEQKDMPVYLYRFRPGMQASLDVDLARSMEKAGLDLQEFDLRETRVDYNSLPNLVRTMRVSRYSLVDEVMATPLKKLDDVFRAHREVAL